MRASKAPEKCHRLIAEIPYVCSAVGNLLENGQKTENVKMSARGLHVLDDGLRYRGVLRIGDYEEFRKGNFSFRSLKSKSGSDQ